MIPDDRSVPALFLILGAIGASALAAQPCVLEVQATWTHPVSPEFSTFICCAAGKVCTAVFVLLVGNIFVMDKPMSGQPEGSLFYGQIFLALMCWVTVPCTWLLGFWIFKKPAHAVVQGT